MNNSILFSIDNCSLELHSLNRTSVSLYITFRFPVYLNDNICFPNRSFLFKYFFIQTRDLFTMRFRRTTRWSRYCVTHEDRNWNLFSGVFDQFRREIYKGSKKNSVGCCWGELTGRRNGQPSLREPRTFSTMSSWAMWNLFQRRPSKVKLKGCYQLASFCLQSAVVCFLPCSMVKWQRLKVLFNCLTVTRSVCWSYFVSYAATK